MYFIHGERVGYVSGTEAYPTSLFKYCDLNISVGGLASSVGSKHLRHFHMGRGGCGERQIVIAANDVGPYQILMMKKWPSATNIVYTSKRLYFW